MSAVQTALDALNRQGTLYMSKRLHVFMPSDSQTDVVTIDRGGNTTTYTTHAAFTAATGLLTRRQATAVEHHVEQWAAIQYSPGSTLRGV